MLWFHPGGTVLDDFKGGEFDDSLQFSHWHSAFRAIAVLDRLRTHFGNPT
jgi:hypothetical protein